MNRDEQLERFWKWATDIPEQMGNSFALIGRRRTGKTAILHKLFNRLFHEQDRVLPVYISFAEYQNRKEPLSSYEFAEHYFSGYVRCYLAFHYREPILVRQRTDFDRLFQFAQEYNDEYILDLYHQYRGAANREIPFGLVHWVINFPSGYAATHNLPTAIIIDEFQVLTNVYDPKQEIHHDLTDSFQNAAETWWAPLLVSGSAVSFLVHRALTGMLQGRFHYSYLRPLKQEYAYDLIFRLAKWQKLFISEELAKAIWQLTAGYPYSIYCLLTSYSLIQNRFPSFDALDDLVYYELTNPDGKLWQHYREEYEKYSHELNEGQTTRKVMLWATKYPDQRIDTDQVAREIGIDEPEVRATLEKLRWIDVVEKPGLLSYQGPSEPMMRRFIEYQHAVEIEQLGPEQVVQGWEEEIKRIRGHLSDAKGEIGELYVRMVMRGFDGRSIDGPSYFGQPLSVHLPKFDRIERRGGLVIAGDAVEIDVIAEWFLPGSSAGINRQEGVWLVEAKYTQARIGKKAIHHFFAQVDKVRQSKSYSEVVLWFFSKAGFTQEAEEALKDAGILYSDWATFSELANLFGFYGLPEQS
ncbi:MAG: hypothetical protein AAF702_23565 [Chloroflexota bacterium]